jgi:hypothetical protein
VKSFPGAQVMFASLSPEELRVEVGALSNPEAWLKLTGSISGLQELQIAGRYGSGGGQVIIRGQFFSKAAKRRRFMRKVPSIISRHFITVS